MKTPKFISRIAEKLCRRNKEDHHSNSFIEFNIAVNALNQVAISNLFQEDLLTAILNTVLTIPWVKSRKGVIFIQTEDGFVVENKTCLDFNSLNKLTGLFDFHEDEDLLSGKEASLRALNSGEVVATRFSQGYNHICIPIKPNRVLDLYLLSPCTSEQQSQIETICIYISEILVRAAIQAEIQRLNNKLLYERDIIEKVVEKQREVKSFYGERIKFILESVDRTAGDIVFSALSPAGKQHILVGDFTGHGLFAALGSPIVSDIFYSMTHKGLALEEIILEINKKLVTKLTTGQFLNGCFIELDINTNDVRIGNYAMPPTYAISQGELIQQFNSDNCGLGIVSDLKVELTQFQAVICTSIFVVTDGITEARNQKGEMFGDERTLEALLDLNQNNLHLDQIKKRLIGFTQRQMFDDDATILQLEINE